MKEWREIGKNFTLVAQLGLSLVMPTLICVGLTWYLCDRFGIGTWLYIPGFILGLGSSAMTAYKFYVSQMNKEKKSEKKGVSFNEH